MCQAQQARKSNAADAIKSSSRHSAQFRSIDLQDRQRQSETPESSESVRCWSKGDRCLEARTRREATGADEAPKLQMLNLVTDSPRPSRARGGGEWVE
ncbi:hypothetical protein E4U32_002242 [Claviceps aff. humidiphila group G2b]|nr:hypothetical protein E4U32_002242 [Claviceps aff. humidiphila group G2b]